MSIAEVLRAYGEEVRIGTLGSHSALNILRGAKDEGFRTVCVCREREAVIYQKFGVADELVLVDSFPQLLDEEVQERLRELRTVLVPHGSFTAYIEAEELASKLQVPIFGNRELLAWEVSREKQKAWLEKAGLLLPKAFGSPAEIDRLVITKSPGARGGKGYFLAATPEDFELKVKRMVERGLMSERDAGELFLQEYVIGTNVYPHYFRSLVRGEVELLGFDRRYESAADGFGRIPAGEQLRADLSPTYTIVGNIPLAIRESLLPAFLEMGEAVVKSSAEIAPPGVIGPFCLETIITEDLKVYCFEISARIVAGTNVWIDTSPYAYVKHGEGMYMGRRIAKEIREALGKGRLELVVT
jgi:5-formaminoimidazole-4-carboxamide-1-(beta)-D-ribofuranosyl 5'-monophosphate synthetase